MAAKRFGHAVVVGSGIAGLVTARVLSEHFAHVTVLERDAPPDGSAPRSGAPQSWHFHGLLPGGLLVLRELFPGFTEDLLDGGSLRPAPHEFFFFRPEGKSYLLGTYAPEPWPDNGSRPIHVQTRGLLEWTIRRRVAALENVTMRYRARVADISAKDGRVTGVRLESDETIAADLVLDAMGRGGHTCQWLEQLGFERPPEDVIHCDIAYTSVFLRPHDPSAFQEVGFFVTHPQRGGGLVRMEQGLWLASVAGRHGDYPPRDLAGFMSFAQSLGQPLFSHLLTQADAISEPAAYRFNQSVRRRFELLTRFPEGLLPIGDTVCHYNPLYGQGMTAACRQANALRRILSERDLRDASLHEIWRDYLPEAYRETRAPWLFAAKSDFTDPRCTGDFPSEERELLALLEHVLQRAGSGDQEALGLLLAIQSLIVPLEALRRSPWPERAAAAASGSGHKQTPG